MHSNSIDSTLCKMILDSIQEDNLETVKHNTAGKNIDLRLLKQDGRNAFFSAALNKDDEEYEPIIRLPN